MNRCELKAAQSSIGLTNEQMADLLACSLRLVEYMRSGDRTISARTEKLLRRELEKLNQPR